MAENNGIFQKITAKKGMGQVFTAFGGVIVLMIIFTCMNRNFASAHNLTSRGKNMILFPHLFISNTI